MSELPVLQPVTIRSLISIHRKYIFLLVVCVGIVYAQSLRFDFVTYDDYELVYQNGNYLSDLSNIATSFKTHAFTTHRAESGYYRPLVLISFILDYQLWQLHPSGYHLSNLLLHIIEALFVFVLLELLTRNAFSAFMGSLLFAFHPLQTGAVAWVAGRHDLLLGLFVIMMMIFYHLSRENETSQKKYYFLTVCSFACALFTKESAAFYLLLFPLYDLCVAKCSFVSLISERWKNAYLIPGIILIVYLLIRLRVFGEVIGAEKLYGTTSLIERIQQLPAIIAENCKFIVSPVQLSIVHPMESLIWLRQPWMILSWFIPLFLSAGIWWSWKKDRIICFGLLWFSVGVLPVLGIFPLAVPILEHRLYVPLMGIAIVFGRLVYVVVSRTEQSKLRRSFPVVIVLFCAISSFMRLPIWLNSETLWRDAIEKAPEESRSYFNLAGYYFERQQYDKTIDLIKTYIILKPDDFTGYSKLRQTLFMTGRYHEAAQVNRSLIHRSPKSSGRYLEAATMYEQLGQLDSAAAMYQEGLQVDSNFFDLRMHLGLVEERQGKLSEAESHLRRVVETQPQHASPLFSLGMFYARKHDDVKALQYLEEGLKFGSPPADVVNILVDYYNRNGHQDKAQEFLQKYHP
jgi:Flp pilus assembly protein TadD